MTGKFVNLTSLTSEESISNCPLKQLKLTASPVMRFFFLTRSSSDNFVIGSLLSLN